MGFLKENKTLVVLFVLSALVALYGTLRDDNVGTWFIIIGILLTLVVGVYGCYAAYQDKKNLTGEISSLKDTNKNLKSEIRLLRDENEKLEKHQKTLEESLSVERDSEGNVISHLMTWGEF